MTWVGSPNFDKRTGTPRAIVMHIAEGGIAAVDSWFANPASEASAHYCVGKNGDIHQYVAENAKAWANGIINKPAFVISVNPNDWTISIEHEGISGELWSDAMYAADAFLLRGISKRWGIPIDAEHVFGHNRIDSVNRKNCPGSGLDWQRLWREVKGGDYSNLGVCGCCLR